MPKIVLAAFAATLVALIVTFTMAPPVCRGDELPAFMIGGTKQAGC